MLINSFVFGVAYDTDAQAYINAVEAADTAAGVSGGLETATKDAINAFVAGCKADGIWTAIKASCILAGARTLAGALVPLLPTMPAPSNVNGNLTNSDYNRKTGIGVASGNTSKALNTNVAANNTNYTLQDSIHVAGYINSLISGSNPLISARPSDNTDFGQGSGILICRSRATTILSLGVSTIIGYTGFFASNRSESTVFTGRAGGNTATSGSSASGTPAATTFKVLANGNLTAWQNGKISFYSIGESLDLALLDARVTALINAFSTAF